MGTNIRAFTITKKVSLDELRNKTAAIDMSQLYYRCMSVFRTNEGLFANSDGVVTAHIYGALRYFMQLAALNITPICVYDGLPPQLKAAQCTQRKERKMVAREKESEFIAKREQYVKAYTPIEYYKALKKLSAQTVSLTGDNVASLIAVTNALGYSHLKIDYEEGEKVCATLVKNGLADFIISRDSDVLHFGSSAYYDLDFKKMQATKRDLQLTLATYNISHQELRLLTIAAGNDYTPGLRKVGFKIGLKLLKNNLLAEKVSEYSW